MSARGLEHRRHCGAVVAGARTGGDRVVVRREHDRQARLHPCEPGHDILHRAEPHLGQILDGGRRLHLRIKAQ